jgi:hypothetical protein
LRRPLRGVALALGAAVRPYDLSGLHHLLEVAQVLLQLLLRLFAEQCGEAAADDAARRAVGDLHPDRGAAPTRRALEPYRPGVLHIRTLERHAISAFG